tara:strand:+ start:13890 stop:14687 length:798 start_codon:yes stop_codon:yes gene_type:complete
MATQTQYPLHLNRYGNPNTETTPILALHGFTGCGADFAPLIDQESLSEHNWCAPDLIGHGKSPTPDADSPYTQAAMIEQVADLIEKPCVLIGYSMGGRLSLGVALAYPEKIEKLILISASPGIRDAQTRSVRKLDEEKLADKILEDGIPSFIEYWHQQPLITTQQQSKDYEALLTQRLKNKAEGLSNSLRNFGQGSMVALWDHLYDLECPTLLITGESDVQYTKIAQAMLQQIPEVKHEVISGSGHAPHLEAPETLGKSISRFLG